MVAWIGVESAIKSKTIAASKDVRTARGRFKQLPGRPVKHIAQDVFFVHSPHRKDWDAIVDQIHRGQTAKLPKYEQSLFDSCFRSWEGGDRR